MSNTPKTRPKKLHGQDKVIQVDTQIDRWRKKLKKQGIKLGRGMEAAEKHAKAEQLRRDLESGAIRKKKFF